MSGDVRFHVYLSIGVDTDAETVSRAYPRCPRCRTLLRGDLARRDGVTYHAGCAPAVTPSA